MKCKVLYRNNKKVEFEVLSRVEIRSGLVIVEGFSFDKDGVLESNEVIEPLGKISLIKGEEE